MRYSSSEKEKVRSLRILGSSLGEINLLTGVPRSTIRLWIKDVKLNKRQIANLRQKTHNALQLGRARFQAENKNLRLNLEKSLREEAIKEIGKLSNREIFLSGIALYWAEGFKNKHEHRLGFCNSDPTMIGFYLVWLEKALGIKKKDLIARISLNISHKERIDEIEHYWVRITGINKNQFTKPFYQNTKWQKIYADNNQYRGILRIHVKNSREYLFRMHGWIEGFRRNQASNVI